MNDETTPEAASPAPVDFAGAAPAEGGAPQLPVLPVEDATCASCGATIDVRGIETFSRVACPACGAEQEVPGKFSHFTLLKHLGTGGMGTTFLAEDDRLGRRVAVKVIRNHLEAGSAAYETFKNEAQSAARLNHPHVAQVYSFGEEGGCPFLEMELVPGGDLAQFIVVGATLDPAFVMRVGLEIAEGLKAAEEVGLFHGDVKPDNILFDENMGAKLVDFGIASRASQGAAGELWGTPFYIAPEKVQKKLNSARSDIYSLGATLYHAIAGKPPYDGEDAIAVIRARFDGPPPPLESLRPDVEPEVSRIVSRMMFNDLFRRYPNYTSLVGDMKKYLSGVSELRKQGPRTAAARAAAATGSFKAEAPAGTATGGKKKLVIQKGQMEAAEAMKEMEAATSAGETGKKKIRLSSGTPSGANPAITLLPPEDGDAGGGEAPKPRRKGIGCSAKVVIVALAALFGLLVIGAVVAIGLHVAAQHRTAGQEAAAKAQIHEIETEYFKAADQVDPLLEAARARDSAMLKEFKPLDDLARKAFDLPFPVPDLEPAGAAAGEPPAPPADAGEAPALPEGAAGLAAMAAAMDPSDLAAIAANLGGEGVASLATAAAPLMASVEQKVLVHARAVRAALREAETLAAQELPVFETGRDNAGLDQLRKALSQREKAWTARTNQLETLRGLLKTMDVETRDMKRGVAKVVQEGQRYVRERERLAEEAALAEERRLEEERRQAAAAAEAARGEEEAARVQEVAESFKGLLDRHDYDTFAARMKRMEPELSTPEGRDALAIAVERADRLKALRKWLVEDVRRRGEVPGGYRRKTITGLSPDGKSLLVNMNPPVPVDKMEVTDWVFLARVLLENRRPERGGITPSEHGEMLFNAALFAYVHGGGEPGAVALARNLAARALEMRESLRDKAGKLLPILDDGGDGAGAPSEGAAALDF